MWNGGNPARGSGEGDWVGCWEVLRRLEGRSEEGAMDWRLDMMNDEDERDEDGDGDDNEGELMMVKNASEVEW